MPNPALPTDRLQKLFRRRKCWRLNQLAQSLDYALISVRRFLKQVGYFRSYTHNGQWYTARDSPRFDRDGLWHFKGIGFSRHGSLTRTLARLIARSPSGLSAGQLSQKLQHPCHAVLTQLHQAGRVDRLQLAGQFRYLAADPALNRHQRQQAPLPSETSGPLNTQTALWVLVEYIKNPALNFQDLAALLQEQRKVAVSPEAIERFFHEHGLKKTPGAPS